MEMTEKDQRRFWAKVQTPDENGCMLWTAQVSTLGYGQFSLGGRKVPAHRFSYELLVGPVPNGLVLDHVRDRGCRNRHCVAVGHLQPVTQAENVRRGMKDRGNSVKTECPQGHPYDEQNTYHLRGHRFCRSCARERGRAYRSRIRATSKPSSAE